MSYDAELVVGAEALHVEYGTVYALKTASGNNSLPSRVMATGRVTEAESMPSLIELAVFHGSIACKRETLLVLSPQRLARDYDCVFEPRLGL